MQEWKKRTVQYDTGGDVTFLYRPLPKVHPDVTAEERKYPQSGLSQISEETTDGYQRLINWRSDWTQYIIRQISLDGETELKVDSSHSGLRDDGLEANFSTPFSSFKVLYLPETNGRIKQASYSNEKIVGQKDRHVLDEVMTMNPDLLLSEVVSIYHAKGDDLFGAGDNKKINYLTLEEKLADKNQLFKNAADAILTEDLLFRVISSKIESEVSRQGKQVSQEYLGLIFWLVQSGMAEIPDRKISSGFNEIAGNIDTFINAALIRTMFLYNCEQVSSDSLSLTLKPDSNLDKFDIYSNYDESVPPRPISTLEHGSKDRFDIYKLGLAANNGLWDFSVASLGRLRLHDTFRFQESVDLSGYLDDIKNPDPEIWKKAIDSSPVRYLS